jgi:hypothetical protein
MAKEKEKTWLEKKKEAHKKELEKLSQEETLEDLIEAPEEDNLEEVLENLEEEIEKNIQRKATSTFTLARGNVALNMDHGMKLEDLEEKVEDAPAKEEDDEDDEIKYGGIEDDALKYTNVTSERIEASQKAMTTPEKLLEDTIMKYSKKEKDIEFEKPIEKKQTIAQMTRQNYQKKDYEAVI